MCINWTSTWNSIIRTDKGNSTFEYQSWFYYTSICSSHPFQNGSSKLVKLKPKTFKPCKLCGYNNHIYDDFYTVLFWKKCKHDDHMTSEHTLHIAMMRSVNKYKSQFPIGSSSRKPPIKAKPFPPRVHCGFNDRHSNDCFKYPGCDICGNNGHHISNHEQIIQI